MITQTDQIGLRGGLNTYLYVGANPVKFIDPDAKNPLLIGVGIATTIYGGYKFYKWCSDASDAADAAQQAQVAADQALTSALNGQPYDPSAQDKARDAVNQSLQSDMQVVNNLPPGTSASPFEFLMNKVKNWF